jgi:hypothetical protein
VVRYVPLPPRFIPLGVAETPTLYLNYLVMRNTEKVFCLMAVISGVSAVNPLVVFYNMHGRIGEVLFFWSIPDSTRDTIHTTHAYSPKG